MILNLKNKTNSELKIILFNEQKSLESKKHNLETFKHLLTLNSVKALNKMLKQTIREDKKDIRNHELYLIEIEKEANCFA